MLKNKIVLLIVCIAFALICAGCVEDSVSDIKSTISAGPNVDDSTTLNADSAEDYEMAAANNAFAFDMYDSLKNDSENVFFLVARPNIREIFEMVKSWANEAGQHHFSSTSATV